MKVSERRGEGGGGRFLTPSAVCLEKIVPPWLVFTHPTTLKSELRCNDGTVRVCDHAAISFPAAAFTTEPY